MFLALKTIAGLPAHALLVHAAVVLVPLAAIALAVLCWNAEWRKHYSLPVAILAVVGAGFALLAKQTGGPLETSVRQAASAAGAARPRFGEHPEQGDTAFFFAMLLAMAAVGVWLIERYRERLKLPEWTPLAAYAAAIVPAVLALVTMIVAGHSGAQLVWKDVGSFAAGR
ncbi:MAG: DUF2231 domain-containing protein [Dehalococcoidia bacterium]